jgi:hypothetical protein
MTAVLLWHTFKDNRNLAGGNPYLSFSRLILLPWLD